MVEVGLEENYDSDSSGDDAQYSKLVYSVSQLDSTQRVKPASRKELTSEVSEYNLIKGGAEADHVVDVNELAAALQKKGAHKTLDRKLKTFTENARTLSKPLEKPEADKIKRQIGFSFIKERLRKWDAIVSRNRLNDHQTFPLEQNDVSVDDERTRLFEKFKPMTPLENEISNILKLNKNEKEEEDETLEFPLTLEEMIERRKEMANLRARQSYKEAKAHRQHKIKSKKYHRILKREKIKEQMKEFEQLQRTDPEAALKKLIEIDKIRAQERASLRHRNTGKWSKNLIVRAKYDKETRKVLADQLSVSRDLTKKVKQVDSDEEKEENEDSFNPSKMFVDSADNPWNLEVSSEVKDFVSGYRKFWMDKNKDSKDAQKVNGDAGKSSSKSVEFAGTKVVKEKGEKESSKNSGKGADTNLRTNNEQSEKLKRKKKIKETESKRIKIDETNKSVNPIKSPKKNKANVNKTPGKRKENGVAEKKYVLDSMSSGLWIVSPVKEEDEELKETKSDKKSKKSKDKTKSGKNDVNIDDLFDHVEKKLEKRIKQKLKKIESNLNVENAKKESKNDDSESDAEMDLSIKNYRNAIQRPDEDLGLSEVASGESALVRAPEISAVPGNASKVGAPSSFEIDPKKYIQVKPKNLSTTVPDEIMGDDAIDDAEEQKMTIMEAFADDNVIEEFKEMKEQEAKSTQLDELVPTLPGWGSWGGTGIKPKKRKKPRLFNVPLPPRKDQNKEDVIINEEANPKLKDHLVKDLPRPFTAVSDFEANVRAPIGRDWIPETAHRKLIEKPVETKLGTVIEPMNTHHIYTMDKEMKSAFKKKQKEKIINGEKK